MVKLAPTSMSAYLETMSAAQTLVALISKVTYWVSPFFLTGRRPAWYKYHGYKFILSFFSTPDYEVKMLERIVFWTDFSVD